MKKAVLGIGAGVGVILGVIVIWKVVVPVIGQVFSRSTGAF
ncbi:MAG: hypothetical protein Q4D16_00320 [Eubacteriales bacterium]|nr:hypothetical protein [Eubacteriales bacterium]